jgi:hypothetical protein
VGRSGSDFGGFEGFGHRFLRYESLTFRNGRHLRSNLRVRLGNGFELRLRRGGKMRLRGLIERDLAIATIAAAAAMLANVHAAGVLRAIHANTGGFLLADAAGERH